jgi:hypothetical protein
MVGTVTVKGINNTMTSSSRDNDDIDGGEYRRGDSVVATDTDSA